MISAAKQMNDRQRHYDKLHHEKRLLCLAGDWGVSLGRHVALTLESRSLECLCLINEHGMSTNSVDLDDSAYLSELDEFASA